METALCIDEVHLLRRQEVADLIRETASLMPVVKSTEEEMRNLLAYLSRLARSRR